MSKVSRRSDGDQRTNPNRKPGARLISKPANRTVGETTDALIARVTAGDRLAARELYEAHVGPLYKLAMRLRGDPDEARELVQDVFVKAFRQIGTFRGESAFSSWLHTILIRTELNTRRIHARRRRERSMEEIPDIADDTTPGIEVDVREKLYDCIDGLPAIYRVTFVMHDLEGYTHSEIAQACGVAEGTSKARLSEARSRLRTALAPYVRDQGQ